MPHKVPVSSAVIYDQKAGDFMRLRNNSGGARSPGEVVIWDTSVTYPAYTTTTTADDALVCGVVASYTASAEEGLVQFRGYLQSENLYANGTTDIAAGDFLSTYTSAGIAQKATTGKAGSFAISLEAFTTNDSTGRLTALLVIPGHQDASATVTYGTAGQMAADGLASTNGAGSTAATARIDHAHAYTNDTPALTFGTSNATGTVGSVLASDASLAVFDTTAPTVIGFADSAAVGTAAFAARRDHTHGSPSASTAPVDGSSHASADAAGTSSAVARADHAHQAIVLDDVVHAFGSDSDVGVVMLTGGVGANTTSSGVLEGTPVTQATPNGSLIIGSVTDGGDVMIAVSPSGNSLEAIRVDASASQVQLGEGVLDTVQWDGTGMIIGSTTQRTLNALVPEFQVQGTTVGVDGAAAVALYSATAGSGPEVILARSKSGTLGTNTIVADGDSLGRILAVGADGGTGFDPAAAIQFEVDGTPGVTTDMPGRILFMTSPDASQTPTESFRVAADQNVFVANGNGVVLGAITQATVNALVPEFQIRGTTVGVDGAALVSLFSSTASEGPEVILARSKNATIDTNTIVASGDSLGRILAVGADGGTGYDPAAAIQFEVDGTPGAATDMPGRIVFLTSPDGSQTPTEVFRVSADQNMYVGNGNGVVIGGQSQIVADSVTAEFQVWGTAGADSTAVIGRGSADAVGPILVFAKGRDAIGTFTTGLSDQDILGRIDFVGADTADMTSIGATIRAEIDGAAGSNDLPSLLRFMTTPDASASPSSRMVIDAAGAVFVGSTDVTTFTGSGGSIVFDEISAPAGTATNQAQIYAYDSAAVTVLAQQKSDGTNADL